MRAYCGGRCEIRTHEGLAALPVFKTGAFNRSANLPDPAWLQLSFIIPRVINRLRSHCAIRATAMHLKLCAALGSLRCKPEARL